MVDFAHEAQARHQAMLAAEMQKLESIMPQAI